MSETGLDYYRLKGDGTEDITSLIQRELDSGKDVFIPSGKFKIGNLVTKFDNQKIYGCGTFIVNSGANGIVIKNNNCDVDGISFEANACQYVILIDVDGKHCNIINNYFEGTCGHYVLDLGENNSVNGNTTNSANSGVTTEFVFSKCKSFSFCNNKLYNSTGFNVQTRFCDTGIIANNTFINSYIYKEIIATEGQNEFIFNIDYIPERKGTQKNLETIDSNISINTNTNTTTNTTTITATVSLSKACVAGDVVRFIGFNSLECININSNCYNITIQGNNINGTGDSGIVLCADYHNGLLDPANVTVSDYPDTISIVGNTIKNCAFAGIAETHPVKDILINDNTCIDCGMIVTSNVISYSTGIFCAGDYDLVSNNYIKNTNKGVTKFGIHVSGYGVNEFTEDCKTKLIGNSFKDLRSQNIFLLTNMNPTERVKNIYVDSPQFLYAEVDFDGEYVANGSGTTPKNTDLLGFGAYGQGVIKDSSSNMGYGNSGFISVGSYLDILIKKRHMFRNSMLTLTFFAKAKVEGYTGFLQFYYAFPNSVETAAIGLDIKPSASVWEKYTLNVPIADTTSNFYGCGIFIRIIGAIGEINIDGLKILRGSMS